MKAIAQTAVVFAPLALAVLLPLIRMLRTGRLIGPFFAVWASFVGWQFVFSIVLPLLASQINRPLGVTVSDWVPEGPAVIFALFLGWFPAAGTVLMATLLRFLLERLKQKKNVS